LPSDNAANDYFGSSLDASNSRIVAGAYAKSDHGTTSGAAYIYMVNIYNSY